MYPIPANATRIRYLESTGTQYVDTGIIPTAQTSFAVRYVQTSSPYQFAPVVYCGDTYNAPNTYGFCVNSGSQGAGINSYYGTVYNLHVGYNLISAGQRILVRFRRGNSNIEMTNETTGRTSSSSFGSATYTNGSRSMYIFSGNTALDDLSHPACIRMYFCEIYDGSTIVRSFVPVRVGQVGYLFDRVSGQLFGNAADNNAGFPAECLGPDTFQQGVVPTRMMPMGVRKKKVWPTPLYTGVNLVGSSVQNNNGILSGFTASSYATMPWRMTSGATILEACIKFHWNGVNTTNSGIWGCVGSLDSFTPFYFEQMSFQPNPGHFGCYLSSNGSSWTVGPTIGGAWTLTYPAAGDYILRLAWNGTTAKLLRWAGSAWAQDTTVGISSIYGNSNLVPQLGTNRGQSYPLNGTIDLNYTYLMRDGELWWEGAAGAYKNVKTTYPD